MDERTSTVSTSRQQTLRWLIPALMLFTLSLGGIWELFPGGAHRRHLLPIFLALLLSGVVVLANEFFHNRRSLGESRYAHDRLRRALLAGSSVAWDLDVKTGKDQWFGDLKTMFGIPAETYTTQQGEFYRLVHPDDRRRVSEAVAHAQKNRVPYACEFRIVREDGSVRWVTASGEFQYSNKEDPVRMLGIATDISDRKLAEEARDKSEEKFAKTFHQSPISMTLTSARNHRYLDVNNAFERDTGWRRDEVIGRTPFDLKIWVDPDERERLAKDVLEQGQLRDYEIHFRRKDERQGVGLVSAELIQVGDEPCILAAIVDITDRKHADEVLHRKESELAEAQRLAHVGSWQLDVKTRTLLWSDELFRIHGLDPKAPAPRYEDFSRLFTPESWERLVKLTEDAIQTGAVAGADLELIRPDGSKRWVSTRGQVVHDSAGNVISIHGTSQDITDRKRSEQELRQKEHDLEEAQRLAHAGSWEWEIETGVTRWSEGLYRIYGLDPTKPAPTLEELQKLYTPETWNRLQQAMNARSFPEMELEFIRPDGSKGWVHARVEHMKDSEGTTIKLRGVSRDITEEKQIRDQLQESEARFRRVVEHIGDAVIADELDGHITFANDRFLELFGFSREQLPKLGMENYIAPEYREQLVDRHRRRMRGEDVPTHFEYEGLRSDGSRMWLEVDVVQVTDNLGKVVGTQSAIRDITERKRSEQTIQQSEERFRRVVEHIGDALLVYDREGRAVFANDRFLQLFGFRRDQLRSIQIENIVTPEYRAGVRDRHERRMRGEPAPNNFELEGVRVDGTRMWLEVDVVPVTDGDGKIVGAQSVTRDITQRKQAQQLIRESEQRLRHLIESSNDWIYETDRNGAYTYVDQKCRELLGYEPEELIGKRAIDLMPDYESNQLRERFERLFAEPKAFRNFRSTRVRKDGRLIVLETSGVPILDNNGEFHGYRGMVSDVTERNQAEINLRESEERFRRVVEHIGDALVVDDTAGRIIFANDRFLNLFSLRRGELANVTLEDYVAPEYRTELRDRHDRRMSGEEVSSRYEFVGMRRDGTRLWIEANIVVVKDHEGRLVGSQRVLRDITEQKRAQQVLRESEERLRHLISSSNDWVWEVDSKGAYTYAGPQCREILGHEPAEIIGKTPFDLMPPDEALRVASLFQQIASEGKPFRALKNVNLHKDGRLVVLESNGVPIIDADGALHGYRGMDRDITERERAEHALRESEERFRLVANTAPVMIWMSDANDRTTYVNKRWLDFTGRSIVQELGEGWHASVHPDDVQSYIENSQEGFRSHAKVEVQYRLRRHDGEYRWILDLGVPRFSPDGTFEGYIGSCIDITERKEAEEAMASIGRRLIEAHEEERTWIGRELHDDINQRLALISVEMDRWLKDHHSRAPIRELVHQVQERIMELSRDVQSLSHRLHSSKLEYLGLAKAADSFCRELSSQSMVEVAFTHDGVPRALPKEISLCVFRVLQEALQNAVKYSGVKTFTVELRGSSSSIELIVSDQGVGFDTAEALNRQGLGLISMRERLQMIRGEFSIQSTPGSGTTIRARVPLENVELQAMAG